MRTLQETYTGDTVVENEDDSQEPLSNQPENDEDDD